MDRQFVHAHVGRILDAIDLPFPRPYRGKVRDSWSLADGRRVMVASDRLSAFDRILCTVPFKGQVLTQTARFWFEATADIVPNHVLSYPDPNVLVCRELTMLPVEMVVRGYLAGTTSTSILTLYRRGERTMYGTVLPDGLAANQRLPQPILTPTTKESATGHDEPLSPAEIVASGLVDAARWEEMATAALALFARGQEMASARGLILADTKYEFGVDGEGRLVLADEIHTPDSSRFWKADTHDARLAAGQAPESFDKDVIRAWVAARCDPYRDAVPTIPDDLIIDTALVYAEAFERITGAAFVPDVSGETVLERVRRNLAALRSSPFTGRGPAAR